MKLTLEIEIDKGRIKSMYLIKPRIKVNEYESFNRGKFIGGDYELMRYWSNLGKLLNCELTEKGLSCKKIDLFEK